MVCWVLGFLPGVLTSIAAAVVSGNLIAGITAGWVVGALAAFEILRRFPKNWEDDFPARDAVLPAGLEPGGQGAIAPAMADAGA